jgi:hypothetical protein
MTRSPDELMAMRFGGATVAENIERSVEAGKLIRHDDGVLELPKSRGGHSWIVVRHGPPMECRFLVHVAFRSVYARGAVPHGCRDCYKVKVAPRTLRGLVAAWEMGKRIECWSKWGLDFYNPNSQDVYAGYFYTSGLDAARALHKAVREKCDTIPSSARTGRDLSPARSR